MGSYFTFILVECVAWLDFLNDKHSEISSFSYDSKGNTCNAMSALFERRSGYYPIYLVLS